MAREVGPELRAAVLDRRRVMRYALGTVAGAIAVPVLTACGGTAANPSSSTSSSASSSSSSSVALPPALPQDYKAPWPLNVGKSQVAVPGSMWVMKDGALEMAAFGNDMWNTADNFAFYGEQVSGDGTWSCEVAIQANTNEWAKAGIMLRQSLDPADVFINLVVSPQHGVFVNYRGVKGKAAGSGPTTDAVAAAPIFLKVQKQGKKLIVSDSTDGQNWQNTTELNMIAFDPNTGQVPKPASSSTSSSGSSSSASSSSASAAAPLVIPPNPVPLISDPFYVGLCACSHDPKLRGRVGFDQITGFKNPTYTSIYEKDKKNNW